MRFVKKNKFLFFTLLPILIFLITPTNYARANTYGCLINGECSDIEALNRSEAASQCAGLTLANSCPAVSIVCHTDADCGLGETCQMQFGSGNGSCFALPATCTSDTDCSGGNTCQFTSVNQKECLPPPQVLVYHCIVIHTSDSQFRPGDCRDFQSTNAIDAKAKADTLCAVNSTEAQGVTAISGDCQSVRNSLAGTSLTDLKQTAAASLNRANLGSPADLIKRAINILMAFIGSITLALYVYAGILWMTASGTSDRVDKAKKIMVWTTLGVFVMLFSYVLVSFLFTTITT